MVKNNKYKLGFSLIESLIALALLSVALLSIEVAILKSSRIARSINNQIKVEIEANNAVENFWAKGIVNANDNLTEVLDDASDFQTLTCKIKGKSEKGQNKIGVSRVLYRKVNKNRQHEK